MNNYDEEYEEFEDDSEQIPKKKKFNIFDWYFKDGKGVEGHRLHGGRAQRPELVAEADDDRGLGYLRAAFVRDREQLKVEGVRLHEHPRERVAEDLPAEELHACLRVGER